MTSISHTGHSLDSDTTIDVRHTDGPVTLVRIESALKSAQVGTILAVLTTEAEAAPNLRSLCRSTNNEYLGSDNEVGHDVHWIKKTNAKMKCERCSNVRTVASGVATIALLSYTTPYILRGGSSAIMTILFIVALSAIPPVAYNNFRFAVRLIKGKAEQGE